MAGAPLGVGNHDAVGGAAEDPAERVDLGLGAAAARRGVGLVRDEHHLARHGVAIDPPPPLDLGDQALHHLADVTDVEPRAVEGAVGGDRAEHLADRREAPLARRLGALQHRRGGAHADQQAVPPAVEGERRLLDPRVGGRGAGGEKAGGEPAEQAVAGDVVRRDDHRAAAPPGADPVGGQREGLGGRRAGGVDLGVGAARADGFGELRVAHGEDLEEEAAIERVGLAGQRRFEPGELAVELLGERAARPLAQAAEQLDLVAARAVALEALDLADHLVVAREGRGEDHPGRVGHLLGQRPALRQTAAGGGRLVAPHQRNAGVAQGVDAGRHRQQRRAVASRDAILRPAELACRIEAPGARRELDHLVGRIDDLEAGTAELALHQAGDPLLGHLTSDVGRNRGDELVAGEQAAEIRVVEDALGARQTEGCTGHHDDGLGHARRASWGSTAAVDVESPLQEVGEEAAELLQGVGGERRQARCRWQ